MKGFEERPLAVLAFDHREQAFASVRPSGMGRNEIGQAKALIYQAFLVAIDKGLGGAVPGILVDEEFGADIAERAADHGVVLVMPVERAAERVFDFEYGANFREHILKFKPTYAKALVRYRPTDEPETKQIQLRRLRELSDFLAEQSCGFMFELIVGDGTLDPDRLPEVDPAEICGAMGEVQAAGICVDLWKLQGIASREATVEVARQAEASEHPARCVVLGAAAPQPIIDTWLDVAASTAGFVGFALGRSIWGGPVTAWLDGALSRTGAIEAIASSYSDCAHRYIAAGSQ